MRCTYGCHAKQEVQVRKGTTGSSLGLPRLKQSVSGKAEGQHFLTPSHRTLRLIIPCMPVVTFAVRSRVSLEDVAGRAIVGTAAVVSAGVATRAVEARIIPAVVLPRAMAVITGAAVVHPQERRGGAGSAQINVTRPARCPAGLRCRRTVCPVARETRYMVNTAWFLQGCTGVDATVEAGRRYNVSVHRVAPHPEIVVCVSRTERAITVAGLEPVVASAAPPGAAGFVLDHPVYA